MSNIAIAYHSGYGHTKKVAEAIASGVGSVEGANVSIIDITTVEEPVNGFTSGWEALQASEGILFGAPTYMAGPSGQFKVFADATAKIWFERGWKDKIGGGFTNSMSNAGDKANTLNYLFGLAAQHEMNWVTLGIRNDGNLNRSGFYVGVGTQSDNDSPEVTPGEGELETARLYGVRFAEAVQRWIK